MEVVGNFQTRVCSILPIRKAEMDGLNLEPLAVFPASRFSCSFKSSFRYSAWFCTSSADMILLNVSFSPSVSGVAWTSDTPKKWVNKFKCTSRCNYDS